MDWNSQLDWAEEIFTMLVVLPPMFIAIAVLTYFAPRLGRRS